MLERYQPAGPFFETDASMGFDSLWLRSLNCGTEDNIVIGSN
jgi:hypothetical protein